MHSISRVSRRSFSNALVNGLLLGVAVILLSMLPSIWDKTGFAGFYVLFGFALAPVIVLLSCFLMSFGRLKDMGLPPVLALLPAAMLVRVAFPFDWLELIGSISVLIPLFVLGKDIFRAPIAKTLWFPTALLGILGLVAIVSEIMAWSGFSELPSMVGPVAGLAIALCSIWISISDRKEAATRIETNDSPNSDSAEDRSSIASSRTVELMKWIESLEDKPIRQED